MALYFKKYIFLKTLVYTIIYLYTHTYFNNFLFVFSTTMKKLQKKVLRIDMENPIFKQMKYKFLNWNQTKKKEKKREKSNIVVHKGFARNYLDRIIQPYPRSCIPL